MNELINPKSGNLTAEQQDAFRLDVCIKQEATNIADSVCKLGGLLSKMNENRLYTHLGFDNLEAYVENAVGMKGRTAYNYIKVYETFGEHGLEKYGALGITKLTAIAQLNDYDRAEILESGKAEVLSTRELEEEVRMLKEKCSQLTFELEETQQNSVDNSNELLNAQNEAADLRAELQEIQAHAQKHSEALEIEINQLKSELDKERKSKSVSVSAISEEEKEEMRKVLEAEQESRHNEELKNAVSEASEKIREEYKDKLSHEAKKTDEVKGKLEEAERRISADTDQINQLNEKLKKMQAENEKLQAHAQKALPSGNKELLKHLMQSIVSEFNKAAELLKTFPTEEQGSCKVGLKKVADAIKAASENL